MARVPKSAVIVVLACILLPACEANLTQQSATGKEDRRTKNTVSNGDEHQPAPQLPVPLPTPPPAPGPMPPAGPGPLPPPAQVAPDTAPLALSFTDTVTTADRIGGELDITPDDEGHITGYSAFFGRSATDKIGTTAIATLTLSGNSRTVTIPDTARPINATHLLVYAHNAAGLSSVPAATVLTDAVATGALSGVNRSYENAAVVVGGAVDNSTLLLKGRMDLHVSNAGAATTISSSHFVYDGTTTDPVNVALSGNNGAWNANGQDTPSFVYAQSVKDALADAAWVPCYGCLADAAVLAAVPSSENQTPLLFEGNAGHWNSLYVFGSTNRDVFKLSGNFGNSHVYGVAGDDDFLISDGIFKIRLVTGPGDNFVEYTINWENSYYGDEGNDIFALKQAFASGTTIAPNNSMIQAAGGNDHIYFGVLDQSVTTSIAEWTNNGYLGAGAGNDTIVMENIALTSLASVGNIMPTPEGNIQGRIYLSLGDGGDTLLFNPLSFSSPGSGKLRLGGGAGRDTFAYHREVPVTSGGNLLDAIAAGTVEASGFEVISMKAVSFQKGRGAENQVTRNNTTVTTLTLSPSQALALADDNDLGGHILYVDGDTDGTDRIDLTGYAANAGANEPEFAAYEQSGMTLMVRRGLMISTDAGGNWSALP